MSANQVKVVQEDKKMTKNLSDTSSWNCGVLSWYDTDVWLEVCSGAKGLRPYMTGRPWVVVVRVP
jgi:hypothetical protein